MHALSRLSFTAPFSALLGFVLWSCINFQDLLAAPTHTVITQTLPITLARDSTPTVMILLQMLPLYFKHNVSQFPKSVEFVARSQGFQLALQGLKAYVWLMDENFSKTLNAYTKKNTKDEQECSLLNYQQLAQANSASNYLSEVPPTVAVKGINKVVVTSSNAAG